MRGLFSFIGAAIARHIGTSTVAAVSLVLGVNVEDIMFALMDSPPVWLTHWLTPWAFVLIGLCLLAWIFYRQVEWLNVAGPQPDIEVHNIIDYVVNNSGLSLPHSSNSIVGVEHDAAMRVLDEHLVRGDICLSGREQTGIHPNDLQFERSKKPIPVSFWQNNELAYFAVSSEKNVKYTQPRQSGGSSSSQAQQYTELWGNKAQIRTILPPKPAWKWVWNRLCGKKRITYG